MAEHSPTGGVEPELTDPISELLEEYLVRRDLSPDLDPCDFLDSRVQLGSDERAEFQRRLAALGLIEETLALIEASPPLLPGERIGRFEILGLLGRGGMGEVYRARDPRLERTVALKVLHPATPLDERRLRRFQREAATAGRLSHPDLVTVFDLEEAEGRLFITMEFVEGRTLRQVFADTAVPIEERVRLIARVARAVGAAHRAGIVHRDLKPENIMLGADGAPKVLDFGLAKRFDDPLVRLTTSSGQVIGTSGYMSPEQILGRDLGPPSDQFALAAVLFEWLGGQVPFPARQPYESAHAIVRLPPRRLVLDHPAEAAIERVLLRALAKTPRARYPSIEEFAADLERALDGRRPRGGRAPAASLARRRLALWTALFLATALFGLKALLDRSRPPGPASRARAPAIAQYPFQPHDEGQRNPVLARLLDDALATELKYRFADKGVRVVGPAHLRAARLRAQQVERAHQLGASLGIMPAYHLEDGHLVVRLRYIRYEQSSAAPEVFSNSFALAGGDLITPSGRSVHQAMRRLELVLRQPLDGRADRAGDGGGL